MVKVGISLMNINFDYMYIESVPNDHLCKTPACSLVHKEKKQQKLVLLLLLFWEGVCCFCWLNIVLGGFVCLLSSNF